jgi:hypothetical protein
VGDTVNQTGKQEVSNMQLDLSPEEAGVLDDLLRERLGDLKEQIYKTEVAEYKTTLKQRESTLLGLLGRLQALGAGTIAPT